MKKNLFYFDKNYSSDVNGSLAGQIACEPCALECEKIKRKINNRKLSDITSDEAAQIFSLFNNDS